MTMIIYLLAFIFVLSIVVIVHEGGHFVMARLCGVKVTVFSVGFGKKLWSRMDKKGTEWRLCALPLGGYVQMLGDEDAASMKKSDSGLSEEEKNYTFMAQPLYKRALIIFAGPFMNYLFAIVGLALVYMTIGQMHLTTEVGEVIPGSMAEEAGILPGDVIVEINGQKVEDFSDLKRKVVISNFGEVLTVVAERGTERVSFHILPKPVEGEENGVPLLGVRTRPFAEMKKERYNPVVAVGKAVETVYVMTIDTTVYLWQVITGQRSADDMRGPVGIAEASGDAAKAGMLAMFLFLIQVSVGIGFVNLLPIPLLDGGHLAMYAYEAVVRRPMSEALQNALLKVGVVLLLFLFAFTLFKDVPRVAQRMLGL